MSVVSKVESIYDGDTITVTINKWPALIGDHIEIRVNGIDTAEMHASCPEEKQLAIAAKSFTVNFLNTTKRITLRNLGRDKYFRIDADIYVDGKSLAEELIKAKLAKPYDGGTKSSGAQYQKQLIRERALALSYYYFNNLKPRIIFSVTLVAASPLVHLLSLLISIPTF